jgi:predicted neutral ceramidase superfamily lipid hydrolase
MIKPVWMRPWVRRTLIVIASVCVPFVYLTVLIVITVRQDNPIPASVLPYLVFSSVVIGFLFLVLEFWLSHQEKRIDRLEWPILIALVYTTAMYVAVIGFSLGLGMWMTGDSL